MKAQRHLGWSLTTAALLLAWAQGGVAQSFSSGSTGADQALNVTTTTNVTVRAGGVYHYTTVNISGTLNYQRGPDNAPVVILATGDVVISGTISLNGAAGAASGFSQSGPTPGGAGGPGGFNGGNAGFVNPPVNVLPTPGQGPGGGLQSIPGVGFSHGGLYGAPTAFVTLTPLFGGSGGGAGANGATGNSAASGGGGGGAILIASSTRIIINGTIRANGGIGGINGFDCERASGAGSGGAIRLVAPEISGAGTIQALRPVQSTNCGQPQPSDGRIRVEAFNTAGFTGVAQPTASVANAPGAVSPAGNPTLANVPNLQIASIGGLAVPAAPAASYSVPDVTLPLGTSNPVPVVVNATNTPVGAPTVITVRLMRPGQLTSVNVASTDHTGTFASSTATANVTLASGQVTVLQAHASMTLTGQTASLFPLIDGEPVEQVAVVATPGEPSKLSLVTRSGKEVAFDQLGQEDRLRVARAWDAMKATRTE